MESLDPCVRQDLRWYIECPHNSVAETTQASFDLGFALFASKAELEGRPAAGLSTRSASPEERLFE